MQFHFSELTRPMTSVPNTPTDRRYRIGIDVGGTFTDFVMAERIAQRLVFHKEPSVPSDPARAIARGIAHLLQLEEADASQIEVITHGTTIGLNSIIQERGCRVALVVSRGNRDVMELARGRLPSSYNFKLGREKALVGRQDVFEVGARSLSDGTTLQDVDEAELDELARTLAARGYNAVAVMLINSYVDPGLEQRVADGLRQRLDDVPVTASSALWPEVKEYERALVAVLNAYIHPLMSGYFDRLSRYLDELNIRAHLYVTSNNGGTMSIATARERPVDTILSGPASGVSAAARLGPNEAHMLTFDMGGTSSDVSSILKGELEIAQNSMVGDYPLILPVVSVSAVGAGGGSIAWRDLQGVLKVGPRSAGANPGPVSYSRGGTEITITDALLSMGILHPDRFLEGRMPLDSEAVEEKLEDLGHGLDLGETAEVGRAICRVATVKMATEISKLLAKSGLDPRECTLAAFGGAGPTTALMLAEEAGINRVLVPSSPGTFCAMGALLADVQRNFVRPCRMLLKGPGEGLHRVTELVDELRAEATDWIAEEGDLVQERSFRAMADLRYPGQSFEFGIPISVAEDGKVEIDRLIADFHAEHARVYGFREEASGVEIVNVRMTVIGKLAPISISNPIPPGDSPMEAETRKVLLETWTDVPVLQRRALGAATTLHGPVIIEQPDTTTLVLPGWTLETDAGGNLWIARGRP